MILKNTLRKEINHILNTIYNKNELSNKVAQNIFTLNEWKNADDIYIFISFNNEIETSHIINQAKKDNKKVYAPLINNSEMDFFRIDNLKDSDFITNNYGIKEPPKGLEAQIPKKSSIIIIPGLAFTKNGKRLGRGGGYYDKYLSKNKNGLKVAIAFSSQIVEDIPTENWDIEMDIVVTDDYIYKKE